MTMVTMSVPGDTGIVSIPATMSASAAATSPASATATFTLNSNGSRNGGSGSTWVTPTGSTIISGLFEAFVTVTSGSLTSGTSGSWINLGTTRNWTRQQAGVGSSTCIFTLQIRRASSGVVLGTSTVTLQADVSP